MAFPSIAASFRSFRKNGGIAPPDLGELYLQAQILFSAQIGIIATPGGGQITSGVLAQQLGVGLSRIDTCATNNDSVVLPPAIPGQQCTVYNNTAQTLAVFGQVGDTIAANNSNTQQPTGTGVTQATAVCNFYRCFVAGQWKQI